MTLFTAISFTTYGYKELCFSIQSNGLEPMRSRRYVVATDIEDAHLSSCLIGQHGTINSTFPKV